MPETRSVTPGTLDPAQAAELALLVELEARWENLRTNASPVPEVRLTSQALNGKQKAYEAFRAKLAGYNKRYAPVHVPELLLNTPARLGIWCRTMRGLYLRVEGDLQGPCPVHLLEKAYRWADRIAGKLSKDPITRSATPASIPDAIRALEAVGHWCDELAGTTLLQERA
jgi:hypothetical protein